MEHVVLVRETGHTELSIALIQVTIEFILL